MPVDLSFLATLALVHAWKPLRQHLLLAYSLPVGGSLTVFEIADNMLAHLQKLFQTRPEVKVIPVSATARSADLILW